jgi:hypothetical protein
MDNTNFTQRDGDGSPHELSPILHLACSRDDEPPTDAELAKMQYYAEIELTAEDCAFLWSCGILADRFQDNWLTIELV